MSRIQSELKTNHVVFYSVTMHQWVSLRTLANSEDPDEMPRPSSPVGQDGERRTTFLAEYAFRRVPFSVSANFTFYSDFIQSAKIY